MQGLQLTAETVFDRIISILDYILSEIIRCWLGRKTNIIHFFRTTIQLSNHLWELNVPLIVCRSIGFMGSLRIQIKELTVVESHPDNKSSDLRLVEPFPALEKHFQVLL